MMNHARLVDVFICRDESAERRMRLIRSPRLRCMTHSKVLDNGGEFSLTFYCGELPADEAVFAAGHEPNGYFWEGVATFIAPEIAARLDLDSEGGMFCASGSKADCEALQAVINPLLNGEQSISGLIARAEQSGFQFDD